MKTYKTVSNFIGYLTKPDRTNLTERALVTGSQNVLVNDAEKIVVRGGYTLDGAANTDVNPIERSFDWKTSKGNERNLRFYDDELETRFVDDAGDVNYLRIANGWTTDQFQFAPWWDNTEKKQVLLFVVGNDDIHEWGGGVCEVDSVTGTTITKKGTGTFVAADFYNQGNKTLVNVRTGTEYTYTGGESTTTLTGIADTTGIIAGDFLIQKIRTRTNEPAADFVNDFIKVLNNQAYLGSKTSNLVYISQNDDYTDFSFSSPRVPGEGELFTLDDVSKGFGILDENMIMFSGDDDAYQTEFEQITVGSTLTETLKSKKLRTGAGDGLFGPDFVAEVGNSLAYLTRDKRLRVVQRPQNLESTTQDDVSDPIKPDFDAATWTNGHIKAFKNRILLCSPEDSKVFITETRVGAEGVLERFWQPPQVLSIRRFAVIGEELHGHSSQTPETYKLFTGTNDNDLSFTAEARLSYKNYGDRANIKNFDEWFVEGYVSPGTDIEVTINYDFGGSSGQLVKTIQGSNENILFQSSSSAALGDNPLGDAPLGDEPEEGTQNPKFRAIIENAPVDFYEVQEIFKTDAVDSYFEILASGPNVKLAGKIQSSIKI